MSKKAYTANWRSELHEEFAFWSFREWEQELIDAGFTVLETSQSTDPGSRAYTNPWIVEHNFRGTKLYQMVGGQLQEMADPVTNMVLVGERR